MFAKHSLTQLIPPRIKAAIRRLQLETWADARAVPVEATAAQPEQRTLGQAKRETLRPVAANSFWGRLFDQRWYRITLPAPADSNTWLNWKDQAEATLYVNDKPFFGFNVAHRFCPIPEGTTELWLQSSCVQSGIAHPEARHMGADGSHFEGAFLCRRNQDAWEAYNDLKCLFDIVADQRHRESPEVPLSPCGFGLQPAIDALDPVYRQLLHRMNDALDLWDTGGIAALRAHLTNIYDTFRTDKTFMRCVLSGHAHLDLVWLWPKRIGEIKAVNIFATANNLMERYPEFRFAYSQPASYEAVKEREPQLFEAVTRRLDSGQWQATGAMYVEADTTFACGEALARGFTLGQKGFTQLNGKPSKLLWLPDVFGYSACLPQIMRLSGVEYFFTTKMTWNAVNRFPYSSFVWRGNDGSEVLAHVTQDASYVTHMEVSDIKNPMRAHRQADVHTEYLLPTGYGDGGGGPTDEMCERARRLGSLPGMPAVQWGQPEAFFERMGNIADQLPVYQGECYLEYHRGTFTTHGNLKATFRNLERALFSAEAVSALTGKPLMLDNAWRQLIIAQFHDYIPGSSVWDVYLEGLPELEAAATDALEQAQQALGQTGQHCLFNPHAYPVQRWVTDPQSGAPCYVDLPALSGTEVSLAKVTPAPQPVNTNGKRVSNGLTAFTFNDAGFIDHLECEGAVIPLSAPLGQLALYPDKAGHFEAWDIDRHTLSLGEICNTPARIEPFNEDGVRCGVRVTRAVGKASTATVEFALEAGSPLLHICVDLNWQEPEALLKLLIPTRYAATNARFGIPFGSVLREQTPAGLAAEAMWEVPFNRHLCVFDEGEQEGLMLVSEAKYGASVRSGQIGLSLVRSPRVTGFDSFSLAWPPHLTRLDVPSKYSDIGSHTIRLAIGSYSICAPRERQPAAVAETLFSPPLAYRGEPLASPIAALEGGQTLLPCWSVPQGANTLLLRLHEVAGRRGQVTLKLSPGWHAHRANFDGTVTADAKTDSAHPAFAFNPYQILTLRLERSASQ